MSIAASSTGQRPVLAGSAGWLMAIVAALAIALAGVVALNQSNPGQAAAQAGAAEGSGFEAAIAAAAQAHVQREAQQAGAAEGSGFDAAIVAAAQARAQGEAKQALELRKHQAQRATAQ
jgi:hypothetical protein